jgi:hypothetical protein
MAVPDDLRLQTGPLIAGGVSPLIVGGGMMLFAVALGLTQADDVVLEEWILPIGVLTAFWLGWLVIAMIAGSYYKFTTRRDIERMFADDIWLQWQFPAEEWRAYIDSVYRGMLPEKGDAWAGGKASGCVGLVLAIILLAVGRFAINDDEVMPIIIICALAVFLLLLGIGLFQPAKARYDALKYRKQALRVPEPRFWFGPEGVYDEAFGFTSLEELVEVNDHTKSKQSIKLTVLATAVRGTTPNISISKYEVPVSFPVPAGHEQEAGQLVRRYRQERLVD